MISRGVKAGKRAGRERPSIWRRSRVAAGDRAMPLDESCLGFSDPPKR